jgi:hypothetical protein
MPELGQHLAFKLDGAEHGLEAAALELLVTAARSILPTRSMACCSICSEV